MTETFEVVDAWKSMRLLEEVVLRKEVMERTETVLCHRAAGQVKIERPPAKVLRAEMQRPEARLWRWGGQPCRPAIPPHIGSDPCLWMRLRSDGRACLPC